MTSHPSGRPIRERTVKGYAQPRPWLEGFICPRLNASPIIELVGGFGFARPTEPEDPMYLETRAAKRRPN